MLIRWITIGNPTKVNTERKEYIVNSNEEGRERESWEESQMVGSFKEWEPYSPL